MKPLLICHSENHKALRSFTKYALPVLQKWDIIWMTAHLFTIEFIILSLLLRPTVKQNQDSFQNISDRWQYTLSPKSSNRDAVLVSSFTAMTKRPNKNN